MADPSNTPSNVPIFNVVSTVNPTDNSQSPYFIHLNESAVNRVIAKTFDGTNYTAWAKSVHMFLKVKGKYGFVDGSISTPSPENAVLFEAWEKVNALILCWLTYSCTQQVRNTLVYVTTAEGMWDEFRMRYLKSDGPRVFSLKKSINLINQGTQSITAFYSQFTALCDEYYNYRALPTCKSGKCSCNLTQEMSITMHNWLF